MATKNDEECQFLVILWTKTIYFLISYQSFDYTINQSDPIFSFFAQSLAG